MRKAQGNGRVTQMAWERYYRGIIKEDIKQVATEGYKAWGTEL